jgi:hypothetical protein
VTVLAPVEPPGIAVCVLSVDTPFGIGGALKRKYKPCKSLSVARLFAHRDARKMFDEGYTSLTRGVFVRHADGTWETIGSYFDVEARKKHLGSED